MPPRVGRWSLVFCWSLVVGCWSFLSCTSSPPPSPIAPPPRLAILIVVDQMRGDYLERFRPLWKGGFRRLLDEGLVFTNAEHDHACTQTAPGHATISTGVHPGRSGILGNTWYDRDAGANVASVEDANTTLVPGDRKGASPRRLEVPAFADWLRERHPETIVVSLSAKDRSAILLGGRDPRSNVYWHDELTGRFVTSTYYRTAPAPWIDAFNTRRPDDAFRDRVWDLFHPDPAVYALSNPDDAPGENDKDPVFPHRPPPRGRGDAAFYTWLEGTPWMDEILFDAARDALAALPLGRDDVPDLLAVSLTPTDIVGHRFGPNSREMQDQLLRLDAVLGRFLDDLAARFGRDGIVVALTGDHGVLPLPEDLQARGFPGRRIAGDVHRDLETVERELAAAHGEGDYFVVSNYQDLVLHRALLRKKNLDPDRIADDLAARLRSFGWVRGAYTRKELLASPETPGDDRIFAKHACHPVRSGDVLFQPVEYALLSGAPSGTSHGTVYRYDRHVPIVFWGGVPSGVVNRHVRTVDIAPTLARLLRVPPPGGLDGGILPEAVDRRVNR